MHFFGRYWKPIVTGLISISLVFIGFSYFHYGLRQQPELQTGQTVLLLFAGLLLGRRATWITGAAILAVLLLGLVVDIRVSGDSNLAEHASDLLQPGFSCAIIALVLDRLLKETGIAERRAQELDLVREQLEIELIEKELKQAQLVHSQKMDAVGKLASGIAHDFNNLVGVILGLADEPLAMVSLDAATKTLADVKHAATKGRKVISQLLSLSRPVRPKETFDVGAAVEELEPLMRSLFDCNVELSITIPDGVQVHMVRDEFELAILNICSNANDAMPSGGRFALIIHTHERNAWITMSDTGCGIAPEAREHIFDLFYTTKPKGIGTGIGLAVVYQTVIAAHGEISLESAEGQGTTISIKLPMAA